MSSIPQNDSKIKAPKSEAQSHKPTFGAAAEKPGTEQKEPEGDPTVSEHDAEKHDVADEVKESLQALQDQQASQIDPDKHQRDIHQPTTQDVLADPISRPKTIDPATGQVHYVGDAAALNGGTASHESDS
jgi:hypothetical protein